MKRILSLILAMVMVVGLMPMTAFAAEETEVSEITETTEVTEATEQSDMSKALTEIDSDESEDNPWKGKSAVFVGDSITAGAGTTKTYYQFLKETLEFGSVTAMGVSGSCISSASDYGQKKQPLINRYQNIPSANLIVVFMGTNDYGHETPLGSAEDTQDGTFYGALNTIVPALVAKHPSSKIVFVTSLHRYGHGTSKIMGIKFTYDYIPNGVGATLGDYVNAVKTVCANNGVSVIDLHTECTLDPSDAAIRSTYMPDGIHPNAAGHKVIAGIMESHIRGYEPVESEPVVQTEMIYGNKFAASYNQPCRASSRVNYYLKGGTVIVLKNPDAMQWACVKTSDEYSSNNLGYFPDKQWTDKVTAVVAEDGWVGFTFKYRDETQSFNLSRPLSDYVTIEEPHTHFYEAAVTVPSCTEQGYTTYTCACGDSYMDDYVDATSHTYENGICTGCGDMTTLAGKTLSILGASISTYTGISNNISSNATIGKNAVYYTEGRHGVYADDTWWMQAANDLGLRLLVNNSWSGSALLHERNGTVGAYVNRCVQLHNNQGEEPDIIAIQMGTNDFQYYKDTLGTADIDYAALIKENADGTFAYATPVTSLEAAAIVLHKISIRYPNAEVYYLNVSQRVDNTDELIRFFNAELKRVVEHFGASIVDIYGSAITMERFDTYIGDGKAHPNKMGMDAYTEAFKRAVIANTNHRIDTHTVSFELEGVSADYGDNKIVVAGDAFSVNLTAVNSLNVTVTMGGEDITASAYADGTVAIDAVTADVTVIATSFYQPRSYRWEFDGTDLVCLDGSNPLVKKSGTTASGVFSNTCYALTSDVVLKHNFPWAVEWKCEGTFLNSGSSTGARVFSSTAVNAEYHARSIFKSNINGLVTMGEKTATGSHNYGIALGNYGIDWTALHTYRLENRISADGSNMVYLLVDGVEIGPMNHYYIGTTDQKTTSDWLSGKDFVFPYMGTDTHGFTNAAIEYIAVWEGGHSHIYENGICTGCGAEDPAALKPISLRYDDHMDVAGKTVEIIDAGMPTSYQVGATMPDTAVMTLDGDALIATGIGTAKVSIDGKLYEVAVEAAPISLFMITGHSMGAGQNGNANQSVVGPAGQVYSSHGTTNLNSATSGVGISYAAGKKAKNVNAFTDEGAGTIGEGSALAWEYNYLTGEKVWVLNTAVGGSNLKEWLPGTTNYKNAVTQFQRAQVILSNEIEAGHYTLSNMGILYHNGANFSYKGVTFTQQDLKNWYDAMWNGFKKDLLRDVNGDGRKETPSFLGLVPIWTKSGGVSYTQDEPAGLYMAASETYEDIFTASVIGKDWLTNESVSALFPEQGYETQNGQALKRPEKTSEVFSSDNVHYLQVAYNAVGIDIARNITAYLRNTDSVPSIKLLLGSTHEEMPDEMALNYGIPQLLVPIVDPITASELRFEVGGCISMEYPLQITAVQNGTGTLTVFSGDTILKTVTFTCADAHSHEYTAVITAPTCSEKGYTTYTCECGDSYVGDYVDATGHTYKSGICTGCGAEHPNLATYQGKVISILGDSISTFAGYIPVADGFSLEHRTRYPDTSRIPDVTDVSQTWWMQTINELDAKLGINESWAGSCIYWGDHMTTKNGDTGEKAAMASLTRIQNLGSNGTPDVIFLYGGGNDKAKGVTVGRFDPANVPAEVDLTATKWDTFADSCVAAIMRMQHYYPNAELVVLMSIAGSENDYIRVMREICGYFNVPFLFLNDYGLTPAMHPDGSHPNTEGMDVITEAILQVLADECAIPSGENTVYSIMHQLSNASASKHYYKGISAGSAFTEMILGEELTVKVTMGGADITADCYANGMITIENVSADVVITATGVYNCDGHLQQLPGSICAGTNIWTLLEPENIYYTVNGWGLFSNQPDVHSVTFPVKAGEKLWATSFGKTPQGTGTRITWFSQTGVLETVSRDTVYAEFATNGSITVPTGAVAVNIPMGDASKDREIYLLDRAHEYASTITLPTCTEQGFTTNTCTVCGDSYVADYVETLGHDCFAGLCRVCGEDTVTASLDGNVLALTGEIVEGTRILVASYNGDERFCGAGEFIWRGELLAETLPAGEIVKLFFLDENWLPLRSEILLK